ncbi:hypothetical protein KEM52_005400 [Ascosphaera acerosa]|nr:hypothetical protein KEM52_005400 [Ascosphaera acerosa]
MLLPARSVLGSLPLRSLRESLHRSYAAPRPAPRITSLLAATQTRTYAAVNLQQRTSDDDAVSTKRLKTIVATESAGPDASSEGLAPQLTLGKDRRGVQLKKPVPRTPGLRHVRRPINDHLWKGRPLHKLTFPKKGHGKGGRNFTGRVTVRHRGGGHKRRIRTVDFKRMAPGPHLVERIEHDPNRSGHIALVRNQATGEQSYILAVEGLRAGDTVESYRAGIPQELRDSMGGSIDHGILAAKTARPGNCLPLSLVPVGTVICNIGLRPSGGGQMCRGAGTYGVLVSKQVELPDRFQEIWQRVDAGEQIIQNADGKIILPDTPYVPVSEADETKSQVQQGADRIRQAQADAVARIQGTPASSESESVASPPVAHEAPSGAAASEVAEPMKQPSQPSDKTVAEQEERHTQSAATTPLAAEEAAAAQAALETAAKAKAEKLELRDGESRVTIQSLREMRRRSTNVVIRLSSGELRYIHMDCCATIGKVSNPDYKYRQVGKAGRSRWLNIRPTVRGVAMNAKDHPHGGGRGKSKGNVHPKSPWGMPAKSGYRTRPKWKVNKAVLVQRPRNQGKRRRGYH